jgi:transcriptional regulator with XRE-family HTH domain
MEKELTFGERLKFARKKAPMTQQALAEKINVKQNLISRIESGQVSTTSKVVALADTLNVSVFWLQTGKGSYKTTVQLSKLHDLELALEKFNLTREELLEVEKAAMDKAMSIYIRK